MIVLWLDFSNVTSFKLSKLNFSILSKIIFFSFHIDWSYPDPTLKIRLHPKCKACLIIIACIVATIDIWLPTWNLLYITPSRILSNIRSWKTICVFTSSLLAFKKWKFSLCPELFSNETLVWFKIINFTIAQIEILWIFLVCGTFYFLFGWCHCFDNIKSYTFYINFTQGGTICFTFKDCIFFEYIQDTIRLVISSSTLSSRLLISTFNSSLHNCCFSKS